MTFKRSPCPRDTVFTAPPLCYLMRWPVRSRTYGQRAGLGNLVTGLLGAGYTGSYIFSQTLFAMRAGVATRLHSWIIAAMELGMFALPFSVRAPLLTLLLVQLM